VSSPSTIDAGLPPVKHEGHQSATWLTSTIDGGGAPLNFRSDRALYSWIGWSSVAGVVPVVALASVRAEATNVPTISRTLPRSSRRRSACTAGAFERPVAIRAGSISIRESLTPTSTRFVCAPESSTDCGKTSMNARIIARFVSSGTCDTGSHCVR
jgi:hypothetical protein